MPPHQQQAHDGQAQHLHARCVPGHPVAEQEVGRREDRRDDGGERRIAEEDGDDQPGRERRQPQPGLEREDHARGRGHALAALEAEEHRVQVAQEGRQAHQRHRAVAQAIGLTPPLHRHHGQPALEGIEQQGDDGRRLVARAQHVGGARVLAAVGARVVQPHEAAHQHGEGQRADQVGGQRGQQGVGHEESSSFSWGRRVCARSRVWAAILPARSSPAWRPGDRRAPPDRCRRENPGARR